MRYFSPDGEEPTESATGARPSGVRFPGGRALVCRDDSLELALRAGLHDPRAVLASDAVVGWLSGGRTRHARLSIEGESWVLKAYRRGGAIGVVNPDLYWGNGRFVRELGVAASAQRVGIPTAELIALITESVPGGALRAWLVSRYVEGVRPLEEFVGDPGFEQPEAISMFSSAGELVARMHAAGIDHPDLHLQNIVGRLGNGGESLTYILDWDRARKRDAGSWNPHVNLLRLWRWVQKVERQGRLRSESLGSEATGIATRAFLRGYFRGRPGEIPRARSYFRRRALCVELRTRVRGRPERVARARPRAMIGRP